MILSLKIALRFLKSGKGQTVFIALGIAIGVSVQVFIGLLIQGLQTGLIDKTIGSSSQITITSNKDDKAITDWQAKVQKLNNSNLKYISPAADSPAFLKFNNKTTSVFVRGFDIEKANKIYKYKESIYKGEVPANKNEVLIGKELQEELGVEIGQKIKLLNATGVQEEMLIKGFYDLKVVSLNKSWIITTLETSQGFFNMKDTITSIEMQVTEVFKADELATQIKSTLADESLQVSDWKTQNAQLLSGLNGQSISSIMIQVFVLIAVILGIASVLAISVLQKARQLGILKAMGIRDKTASLIFLFQGFILGLIGAVLGIAFGLGLCIMFTKFALNPDNTPVIPLTIDYGFILISASIAVVASMLASLVPAIRSSKLNPIEVIKNG